METSELPQIEGLSVEQMLTLVNCRSFSQYLSMLRDYLSGKCPFCDPLDPQKNQVVQVVGGWRMWENPFGMPHARHLVAAPIRHVGTQDPLSPEDFQDLGRLFIWAQERLGIRSGGMAMRFGDPSRSACSVLHRHVNIVEPDGMAEVGFVLCKAAPRRARCVQRFHLFERMRGGLKEQDLSEEERVLLAEIA